MPMCVIELLIKITTIYIYIYINVACIQIALHYWGTNWECGTNWGNMVTVAACSYLAS